MPRGSSPSGNASTSTSRRASRERRQDTAEEIAARTVNKERARAGESRPRAGPRPTTSRPAAAAVCARTDGPGGRTRDQLYNEAKQRGIEGRSKMTKAQLERAVDQYKVILMAAKSVVWPRPRRSRRRPSVRPPRRLPARRRCTATARSDVQSVRDRGVSRRAPRPRARNPSRGSRPGAAPRRRGTRRQRPAWRRDREDLGHHRCGVRAHAYVSARAVRSRSTGSLIDAHGSGPGRGCSSASARAGDDERRVVGEVPIDREPGDSRLVRDRGHRGGGGPIRSCRRIVASVIRRRVSSTLS